MHCLWYLNWGYVTVTQLTKILYCIRLNLSAGYSFQPKYKMYLLWKVLPIFVYVRLVRCRSAKNHYLLRYSFSESVKKEYKNYYVKNWNRIFWRLPCHFTGRKSQVCPMCFVIRRSMNIEMLSVNWQIKCFLFLLVDVWRHLLMLLWRIFINCP